jgi:acetyl esterase/lipase
MVHRGIYDAAKGLYAQLLPFVKQHIKENGGHMPRLRFAGHSLGGSLAVLMSLMLQMRVRPETVILCCLERGVKPSCSLVEERVNFI